MEFFRIIDISITEQQLRAALPLSNLEAFSTELILLDTPGEHEASIGGVWGEFTLQRTEIRGGLRFALLECPNALCWTVTTGYAPAPDGIVLHLTINRQNKAPQFVEEIEGVLEDMARCLQGLFGE